MKEKPIELDSIWRTLGIWGKFQVFQSIFLAYNIIPACFTILSAVFVGYIPEYSCKELNATIANKTDGITYEYGKCEIKTLKTVDNITELLKTDTCTNGYKYSVPTYATYSAEWDLVCARSKLPALAQSLVLAGQGVGAFFMSHLADRFGRKLIQVTSSIGLLLSNALMALSPNIIMILVLRLVAGTFQQGVVCTDVPMRLEIFPRERRAASGAVFGPTWAIGVMLLALFGYIFQNINWRYLQLALAAWSLISLAEWWILEESVRWLLVNGRMKQAKSILQKAARWNKVEYDKIDKILSEVLADSTVEIAAAVNTETNNIASSEHIELQPDRNLQTETDTLKDDLVQNKSASESAVVRYTIKDIMKDRKLRTNTFILWFAWFTVASTYYGLTLVSTRFAGDRFLNFFLSGLFEIPSIFILWFCVDKIGRKKAFVILYALTGCSLIIATGLLSKLGHIQAAAITATGFSLIGKMSISGAFGLVFLYTPEVYPTNYRNRGLGVASSLSRIGAMLSPFASNLADIALWIPAAIFGTMCLLVAVLAIKLPESKHYELPQSMKELHKWNKRQNLQLVNQADNAE